MANIDLFGNEIIEDVLLRDKFIEPPFSILDTKSGNWQKRKRAWISKGLKSEVGRDAKVINMDTAAKECGYKFFTWNGWVYAVDGDQTGILVDDLF